ncbi:hypothetical protein F4774DRAFT_425452 [Daldinia eschscholtzii]|nr:hypothetical protein F4774DRAFT_425452 [Daldinia eschscholtzii]
MSRSHGRSIHEFGLTRGNFDEPPIWLYDIMEYMGAEEPIERSSWQNLQVKWRHLRVTEYNISLPNFAYIFNTVNMQCMPPPRMKHRDLIVDNYRAAGGDLATLRRIGATFIANMAVYECIQLAFAVRGEAFPDTNHIVIDLSRPPPLKCSSEPNSHGWYELTTGNPFIIGQQKMLDEYRDEFKNARIEKVTVAAHEKSQMFNVHLLFMVTHLAREEEVIQVNGVPEVNRVSPPLLESDEEKTFF